MTRLMTPHLRLIGVHVMTCRTILVVFVAYGFGIALCPAADPPLALLMFDGGSVVRLSINGGTATSTPVLKNIEFFQATSQRPIFVL